MTEAAPQTPDVINRYAALEPTADRKQRLAIIGFLGNIVTDTNALHVVNLSAFLGNCVYGNTSERGMQQVNPAIGEIAQAIAAAVPTDPKERQIAKSQLVAARQAIVLRIAAFKNADEPLAGITLSDVDYLYDPAKNELTDALEHF
jgi:hypothetical protein